MNVFSIIVGLVCAVLMGIGLIPFLGWVNWIVLGGCVVGIILGAFSDKKNGLTICAAVMAVGLPPAHAGWRIPVEAGKEQL